MQISQTRVLQDVKPSARLRIYIERERESFQKNPPVFLDFRNFSLSCIWKLRNCTFILLIKMNESERKRGIERDKIISCRSNEQIALKSFGQIDKYGFRPALISSNKGQLCQLTFNLCRSLTDKSNMQPWTRKRLDRDYRNQFPHKNGIS